MRNLYAVAAAAALLAAAAPAAAKELKCNVHKDIVSIVDGKDFKLFGEKYHVKVKDTFSKTKDKVTSNDYNKYVNIKFGEEKSPDYSTNVQVRPRTAGECLNRLEGISRNYDDTLWSGAYCDTKQHKRAGKLTMWPVEPNGGYLWWGVGRAYTTTKVSYFAGIWEWDGKNYLLKGACAEDR